MATVKRVDSLCKYPIECGRDMAYTCLLDLIRERSSEKAPQVAIVTDKEVNGLHHTTFISELEARGVKPTVIQIDGRQSSKNFDVVMQVFERLMDISFTPDDLLVGWGGGSILDVTAFAASTFLGGLPYCLIPTTLMGMLESAEAGTTYLNYMSHKDCISVKCRPVSVIMDVDFLPTVPESFMKNGYAQIIRYAMLDQITLLNRLVNKADMFITIDECYLAKSRIREMEPLAFDFGKEIKEAILEHFRFLRYSEGEALAFAVAAMNPSEPLFRLYDMLGFPRKLEGVSRDSLLRRIMKDIAVYKDEVPVIRASGNGQILRTVMSQAEALTFFSEKLEVICD
ncbi:MAG: iron-containing alcohol dehydrogenase [Clostridiales bacterium]|nr:iron-containing alcohol dehydrogenase [Clostridiales bacterium]MCR5275563.1 iron-containing alcohol dehydrogenase [Clostridiales bacterium]